MKKGLLLSMLFLSTTAFGQFSFDLGISAIASNTLRQNFTYEDVNLGTRYEYSEMKMLGAGVLIYPRYLFKEAGSLLIGIGAPTNLALDTYFQSLGVIDANLTLDIVGGGFNILNESDGLGYYIGAGFGTTFLIENSPGLYGSSGDKKDLYDNVNIVSYNGSASEYNKFHNGMNNNLFVHAGLGNIKIQESSFGFRIGYKPCFRENCMSYTTFSIYYSYLD